jgi:hypothetical protein
MPKNLYPYCISIKSDPLHCCSVWACALRSELHAELKGCIES